MTCDSGETGHAVCYHNTHTLNQSECKITVLSSLELQTLDTEAIKQHYSTLLGDDVEILVSTHHCSHWHIDLFVFNMFCLFQVAEMEKNSPSGGLGISLEGTQYPHGMNLMSFPSCLPFVCTSFPSHLSICHTFISSYCPHLSIPSPNPPNQSSHLPKNSYVHYPSI